MENLILELIPSAIGLALTPTAIAACILFLGTSRPVTNALSFTAPFAGFYTLLSLAVLTAAGQAAEPLLSSEAKHAVLLAVGLTLLAFGFRMILIPGREAGAEPKWMKTIATSGPRLAFGLGCALAILNPNVPILAGGLSIIAAAEVSRIGRLLAAAFLVSSSVLGLLGSILWFVVEPERASRRLQDLKAWLVVHQRRLNEAVLLVFGAIFTLHGLAGL
jgi:hypothetical protein